MNDQTAAAPPALPPTPGTALSARVDAVREEVSKAFIGQPDVLDQILIALLAGGHVLIEGVPGLGKTLLVRALAKAFQGTNARIQFTPDLMPSDVMGHAIYDPKTGVFNIRQGPVFTHLLLADEINRAPAKVQSALLEAMQEQQVTIGRESHPLPDPFLVLATQNPIEHEGTYPLPEAQTDRFLMKVLLDYPEKKEEKEVLRRMTEGEGVAMETARGKGIEVKKVVVLERLQKLRLTSTKVYVDERISDYLLEIVFATRRPADYHLEIGRYIRFGASPRGSIALKAAARAHAFLAGRNFVVPEDVKAVAFDVLRHRVILSFEAEAERVTADEVIRAVLNAVEVP